MDLDFLKITSSWTTTSLLYIFILSVVWLFFYYRASIIKFLSEVKAELAKCAWPWDLTQSGLSRYKELIDSTVIVAVTMIFLGSYVSTFDFFINRLMSLLIRF